MENLSYMDETKIDDSLKCDICTKPLIDPVSLPLPCTQTFCIKCIQTNLQHHLNNCEHCILKSLTTKDLTPEGRRIQQMLDHLPVKCLLCSEQNIQRVDFVKHFKQFCPKRIVLCPANDILCSWNGPYEQLDQHLNICPYEKLRSILTELIQDSQHLKQIKIDFQNLQNKFKEQINQILQIENEKQSLNQQIIRIEPIQTNIKYLTDISDQQTNQLNHLDQTLNEQINQIKLFQMEITTLTQQSEQQLNQILELKNENQSLVEQINQIEELKNQNQSLSEQINQIKQFQIENEHLNQTSNQQLNQINIFKDQYQQYQSKINQLENVNQSLLENFNLIQIDHQTIQQQQRQIHSLQQQNGDLKQQLTHFEQIKTDYQISEQQKIQFHYQNEELIHYQKLIQQLNIQITDLTNIQHQHLKQQLKYFEQIQRDYQILSEQSEQQKIEIDYQNEQLIDYQKQIEQLNKQIKDFENIQNDNQTLNQQSRQYQLQIEQLIIQIQRLERKLNPPTFQPKELSENVKYENLQLKQLINECKTNSLINLNGENLNEDDISIVIQMALINKRSESIIFSNNCLREESILKLSYYLNINTNLTKLIISNNCLSDLSIKYLSESLSFNNSRIKELILNSNEIKDQGCIYLSNMFKTNKTIIIIGLQDNQITDQSIQYFSQIVQSYNQTLEQICLYSNKLITDLSIQSISDLIRNNNSLNTFWIWDCQLSSQGKEYLIQSIQNKIHFDLRLEPF